MPIDVDKGGLIRPIPSGTYAVTDAVMGDVERAPYGEHPANLGAYLARRLGAMAYDERFCDDITEFVGKIAPIPRLPGEEEMHALVEGVLRVLHGEQEPRVY